MSGYFSGSNAEADAMQTLYLMNPSYTGFNESSNLGNMVLINPSGAAAHQGNRFDNLGHTHHHHHQQQHGGFSPASTITPTAISQHPHAVASMNHQNSSPGSIFTGRVAEQGYGWNGGNTFSVLSSPDMAEDGHSLAARLGAMNSVHQPASDLSRFGMRSLSQPPIHQQESLIPNGVALDVESLHASGSAGQILSLSLSPQVAQLQSLPLQHPEAGVNDCSGFSNIGSDSHLGKGESFSMGDGILGSFRAPSRDNVLHPGLQTSVGNSRQVSNMVSSASPIELYRSKYLKATQQLLDEVVSVGRGTKNSGNNTKVSSWKGPSAANSEGFLTKENTSMEISGKDRAAASWTCAKEAGPSTSSAPESTAGIPEHNSDSMVELTLAERHDLQMKKTKLMGMLDDVDRRYRQYYHQMQGVVGSFESAAGLGAARTYTTLALQTISKHFRCLKDAIRIQIRTTCRSLGEEDASGQKRGETSRLRFIDQQLRQQRAFQQLGMMQQPAWRPQRGLPERAVTILRAWLFEHFLHPYPKDSDKHMLARQTGLTRNQVSNWFINARVRLWKPMVEEMYAEEIKDEGDGEEAHQRGEGEETSRAGSGPIDGGNNEATIARSKLHDGNLDQYSDPKAMSGNSSDMLQSKSLTGNLSESFLFQERGGMSQGVKRARNAAQDSSPLLSSYSSAHVEFKPGQEIHDVKVRMDERHVDNYSMPHGEVAQLNDQNLGGYGSLSLMGLSRYPHEGLASNYAANSGVSLTLGLQHSDGLSLSGAESGAPQQHYMQGMGQVRMLRRDDDGIAPVNYYGMNENVAGPNSGYVTLDTKRYGNHLLHDFT